MKKQGFTLIEIIVMVGVLGIILISVTIVLTSTFKAKNNIEYQNKLVQNGNFILAEVKKNLLEANPETVVCGTSSLSFTTKKGQSTTLTCTNNQIASGSAKLSGNVGVACDSFSICETYTDSTKVSVVNVGFSLSVLGDSGETISRSFETKVMIRN